MSLQEKIVILDVYDQKSPTTKQTQLAAELRLPVSTLRTLVKNRHEIEEKYKSGGVQRKKHKVGKFDKLEKILIKWFHQTRAANLPISGPIICDKARKIAEELKITDFNASNGWINRFKNRHGIVYRQNSLESEAHHEDDETMQKFFNNAVDVVLKEEEDEEILQDFLGHSSIDDKQLIQNVNSTQNETLSDHDDDVDESKPVLTKTQALAAISDLKSYLSSLDQSEDALQNLSYVENFIIDNTSKT